jgi:hypothetical protein
MRTLSTPTSAAASALVTQPGYLVEIGFATPLRLSSRGTVSALGNAWTAWDVEVSGLAHDPARPATSGALTLGDQDLSLSSLVLGAERGCEVRVWRYFAEAIDEPDPVLVFDGVAGAVSGGSDRRVQIQLVAAENTVLFAPRRRMTRETGFSALPPAGKVIAFNGERYTLQPEA